MNPLLEADAVEPNPKVLLERCLAGPEVGWSARKVFAWLATEGRRARRIDAFLNGLGDAFQAAGAPADRLRFGMPTLHPNMAAMGASWEAGRPGQVWIGGHGYQTSDIFIGGPFEYLMRERRTLRRRMSDLRNDDFDVMRELRAEGFSEYLGLIVPIETETDFFGLFSVATKQSGGFTRDDVEKFQAVMWMMAPVCDAMNMHRVATALLDTYIGHRAGARVLEGRIRRGDGEPIETAIWYSDLRGFTRLSEHLPPEATIALLNTYFGAVAGAITARGGEILQFIGDAVLAIIPTVNGDSRAACEAAYDAAIDALDGIAPLNAIRQRHGEEPIRFGIGLHVGTVIHGNVGSEDRLGFNVVGPAVNRTARLEEMTKQLHRPLLISSEFAALIDRPTESLGVHPVRGVDDPQTVFAVPGR